MAPLAKPSQLVPLALESPIGSTIFGFGIMLQEKVKLTVLLKLILEIMPNWSCRSAAPLAFNSRAAASTSLDSRSPPIPTLIAPIVSVRLKKRIAMHAPPPLLFDLVCFGRFGFGTSDFEELAADLGGVGTSGFEERAADLAGTSDLEPVEAVCCEELAAEPLEAFRFHGGSGGACFASLTIGFASFFGLASAASFFNNLFEAIASLFALGFDFADGAKISTASTSSGGVCGAS